MSSNTQRLAIFQYHLEGRSFAFATDVIDGNLVFLSPKIINSYRWLETGKLFKYIRDIGNEKDGKYSAKEVNMLSHSDDLVSTYTPHALEAIARIDVGEVETLVSEKNFGFYKSALYGEDVHFEFRNVYEEGLEVGTTVFTVSINRDKGQTTLFARKKVSGYWAILTYCQLLIEHYKRSTHIVYKRVINVSDKLRAASTLHLGTGDWQSTSNKFLIELIGGLNALDQLRAISTFSQLLETNVQENLLSQAQKDITFAEIGYLLDAGDDEVYTLPQVKVYNVVLHRKKPVEVAVMMKRFSLSVEQWEKAEQIVWTEVISLEELTTAMNYCVLDITGKIARMSALFNLADQDEQLKFLDAISNHPDGQPLSQLFRNALWAIATSDYKWDLVQRNLDNWVDLVEAADVLAWCDTKTIITVAKFLPAQVINSIHDILEQYEITNLLAALQLIEPIFQEDSAQNYYTTAINSVLEIVALEPSTQEYYRFIDLLQNDRFRTPRLLVGYDTLSSAFRKSRSEFPYGNWLEYFHHDVNLSHSAATLAYGTKFNSFGLAYIYAQGYHNEPHIHWIAGWPLLTVTDKALCIARSAIDSFSIDSAVLELLPGLGTPSLQFKYLDQATKSLDYDKIPANLVEAIWQESSPLERFLLATEQHPNDFYSLVKVEDFVAWKGYDRALEKLIQYAPSLITDNAAAICEAYGICTVHQALNAFAVLLTEEGIGLSNYIFCNLELDVRGSSFRVYYHHMSTNLEDKLKIAAIQREKDLPWQYHAFVRGYQYAYDIVFHEFSSWCKGLIYLKPTDQILCIQRLAMDKNNKRQNVQLADLSAITRVDVDIANMAFLENDDVLDISTHFALRTIQTYLSDQKDTKEAELLEIAYSKLSSPTDELRAIHQNEFLNKCTGRVIMQFDPASVSGTITNHTHDEGFQYLKVTPAGETKVPISIYEIEGATEGRGDGKVYFKGVVSHPVKLWAEAHMYKFKLSNLKPLELKSINTHLYSAKNKGSVDMPIYCEGTKSNKADSDFGLDFFWCRQGPCFEPNQSCVDDTENYKVYRLYDVIVAFRNDNFNKYGNLLGGINRYNQLISHLKCRGDGCNHPLYPTNAANFHAYRITEFHCRNPECSKSAFNEDLKVYLNHCWNPRCDQLIIDSRDSTKCPEGMYICSNPACGHCCHREKIRDRLVTLKLTGGRGLYYFQQKWINKTSHMGWGGVRAFCYKCGIEMVPLDGTNLNWKCPKDGTEYHRPTNPSINPSWFAKEKWKEKGEKFFVET